MKSKEITVLIPVIIFIFSSQLTLYSQTKKGNWLAEGNLGNLNFTNSKSASKATLSTSEMDLFSVSLFPRMGYFVSPNFVIGATLNFRYETYNYTIFASTGEKRQFVESKGASAALIPFARYYFTKNSKNRFYAQLGAGAGIGFPRDETVTYYDPKGMEVVTVSTTLEDHSILGEILVGINHFFTENVAFNTAIGYTYSKIERTGTPNSAIGSLYYLPVENTENSEVGNLVWNFGFTIVLTGKKNKS